jgi:hypothetical protein
MGCVYKNTTLSSEIVYFVSTKYDLKQAFERLSTDLFYLLILVKKRAQVKRIINITQLDREYFIKLRGYLIRCGEK